MRKSVPVTLSFSKPFIKQVNEMKTLTGVPMSRQLEMSWKKHYCVKLRSGK